MTFFVFMALLPGLGLWDVAALSTDCDTLYDSLNRKRLLDPSEAVHALAMNPAKSSLVQFPVLCRCKHKIGIGSN